MMTPFQNEIDAALRLVCHTTFDKATVQELYTAVSAAAMARAQKPSPAGKRVCYLSAEFLLGRMITANLLNLGLLEETKALLEKRGLDLNCFEEIADPALGNGGLGRLAACFLDSGASLGLRLDGFGIRYRYGLFAQKFENGFQTERPDDWLAFGDPWSVRKESERVKVSFGDGEVWAVPYDMPVIGYGGETVNTLRLWQAEAVAPFDFSAFNRQEYQEASKARTQAEAISCLLYPNDDTNEGKKLRLKQQYFFSSATLQYLIKEYKSLHGEDFSAFPELYAIQLNDTHPTVSIPELLRLLMAGEDLSFEEAFSVCVKTFGYTNHTLMAEALEKWYIPLFREVLPEVYPYVVLLQNALRQELKQKGIAKADRAQYDILSGDMVHMARMAIFASHSVNGVAEIHSELLKTRALKEWYALYPERFGNKTNGITQRRWLKLANPGLSSLITREIGGDWVMDLDRLKALETKAEDEAFLSELNRVKAENKEALARYVMEKEGVELDTGFLFDVQIKRLHEYKRQLLNAFSILDIYYGLKEGRIKDFYPTLFLFGAKAAPGYFRAKGIIKYINAVAELVNADPETNALLRVHFVEDYNVSYAEKLIPAADVSEQISTAGTEASGTGNMKFMLNGAVTLGTYDGANIEIVRQAGEENNFIFGARVEDLEALANYDPNKLREENPRIRRVVDTLVDGTFDDGGTGMFEELYNALFKGASWHKPDHYFLLLDFIPYCEEKLKVNRAYQDRKDFAKKCLMNIANAGKFSSDRTIREYARDIWETGDQE